MQPESVSPGSRPLSENIGDVPPSLSPSVTLPTSIRLPLLSAVAVKAANVAAPPDTPTAASTNMIVNRLGMGLMAFSRRR
jgi:hypothetical protein